LRLFSWLFRAGAGGGAATRHVFRAIRRPQDPPNHAGASQGVRASDEGQAGNHGQRRQARRHGESERRERTKTGCHLSNGTPSVSPARSFSLSLSHTSLFHALGCPLSKTLSKCTSPSFSHLSPPQVRAVLSDFAVDEASLEVSSTRLFEFAIKCRDEALFPCLCFQLNSFKCLEMFKELLGQLESRQLVE